MQSLFIIILVLLFVVLCAINRKTALILLCALLPAYLIRFGIPIHGLATPLPSTVLEAMILSLFAVWALSGGIKNISAKTIDRWLAPAIILLLGATVGVLASPEPLAALGVWRAYFIEPLLLFLVVADLGRDERTRRGMVAALAGTVIVIGVIASYQKITGFGIPNPVWQAEATRRVTAFYGFPNAIALFIAPLVPFFLALAAGLVKERGVGARLLALWFTVAAALGIAAVFFAVSEGGLIALAAGLLATGIAIKETRAPALVGLIGALIAVSFYSPLTDYASVLASLRDDSGSVRRIVWSESVAMLADHPVFGAGLAGYQETLKPYHHAPGIEIFLYPHDIALNFWSETGLIGLAGFIFLVVRFFTVVKNGARHLREPGAELDHSFWPPALIGAMVAILVHGLVDVPYFKNDLAALFWILIALTETTRHGNATTDAKNGSEKDEYARQKKRTIH